jgi:hypothetical protein
MLPDEPCWFLAADFDKKYWMQDVRHSGTRPGRKASPAERETPEPDDAFLAHRRADHPERFLRDRAIRVEVIRDVKIDGSSSPRGTNFSRSMTFKLSTSSFPRG